jgi:hypothetical protein
MVVVSNDESLAFRECGISCATLGRLPFHFRGGKTCSGPCAFLDYEAFGERGTCSTALTSLLIHLPLFLTA